MAAVNPESKPLQRRLTGLPVLPRYMSGRPYGLDEQGQALDQVKGVGIVATLSYMLDCVGRGVSESLPPGTPNEIREKQVGEARQAALDELVERLNGSIPEPKFYINGSYPLNEGNSYSFEFDIFFSRICWELSGDTRFRFNTGSRSIPQAIAYLVRPFSLSQIYNLLPRFTAKFAATDIQPAKVTPTSAIIQWRCARELASMPEALHALFIRMYCEYIQGALSSIPKVVLASRWLGCASCAANCKGMNAANGSFPGRRARCAR
jgi:hypothetical protein